MNENIKCKQECVCLICMLNARCKQANCLYVFFIQKFKVKPIIVRIITSVLSILLGCVLFIFVPILVFQKIEKWTLTESAYFVVITLTTVGFGDYVAGILNIFTPSFYDFMLYKFNTWKWLKRRLKPLPWLLACSRLLEVNPASAKT